VIIKDQLATFLNPIITFSIHVSTRGAIEHLSINAQFP
jgi:hypothetical protein